MKRKTHFFFVIIALILAVVLGFILSENRCNIDSFWFQLLSEIDKWIFITVVLGYVVKIIGEDIVAVKKDGFALRKIGVNEVISGKLPFTQKNIMFGYNLNPTPIWFKGCFISGENFLVKFQKDLSRLLVNGCDIKLLLADDTTSEGKSHLKRLATITKPKLKCYSNYLLFAKNVINKVALEASTNASQEKQIAVRFYTDEYLNSFRLACYEGKDHVRNVKLWASYQPFTEPTDCSLSVAATDGYYGTNDESLENEVIDSEYEEFSTKFVDQYTYSFREIWKTYGEREEKYPRNEIKYPYNKEDWLSILSNPEWKKEIKKFGFDEAHPTGTFDKIICINGDIEKK